MGEIHSTVRFVSFPRVLLSLLVLFSLVLLPPGRSARAQEDLVLLYSEDFEDETAPGWSLESSNQGEWNTEGATLIGEGHAWAVYEEGDDWGSAGTYRYRFRLTDLEGGLHTNLHLSANGRYAVRLQFSDRTWRFAIFKESPVGTLVGTEREGSIPGTAEFAAFYTPVWVEILARDGNLKLYITDYDEQPVLVYADDDPLPPGKFAFETLEGSGAQIDEVEVWGAEQILLPDLVIESVDWDVQEEDQILTLRVEVANQGEDESDSSDLYAEIIPLQAENRRSLPPLAPGESAELSLNLEFPRELLGEPVEVSVAVDPGRRVEESNERNNSVQTTVETEPILLDTPETPTHPPENGGNGDGDGLFLVVGGAVLALVLGALVYRLVRGLRDESGPEPEREPEEPSPPVIPIPPVRLLRIWLSEGATGEGDVLSDRHSLQVGALYTLHLQVQPRGTQEEAAERSEGGRGKRLRVVLFSPETDFGFVPEAVFMALPQEGASSEVHYPIRVQRGGHLKLRVGVYYGNVLLQSALLEAEVQGGEGYRPPGPAIARVTDYVASLDLRALGQMPQPKLSLFTNRASDGSHWIGLFAVGGTAPPYFRQGLLHTFGPRELASAAERLRALLTEIQGRGRYRFEGTGSVEQLERDLVRLATQGRGLYNGLFFSRLGADARADALLHFQELLREPGVISVARCRADATSIPWAALYDLYLDTHAPLALCSVFKEQLRRGEDLLDDPVACRAQGGCPLHNDDDRSVCPFGFWGFLHQVEQPLQQVTPTTVDEVPPQLRSEAYEQSCVIERASGEEVEVAVAYYPRLPQVEEHLRDLQALAHPGQMEVHAEDEREKVVKAMLRRGGFHLYYFYCHGEVEGNLVRLKLGPANRPGYVGAADLDPRWRLNWRDKPRPLVILNACETVAMVPERAGELMLQLRFLGSGGVVGTEIEVRTELAREVGARLVQGILEGRSLGEAFLDLRRQLLREGNPLGLAYTYHAPAGLHLHAPEGCTWCRSRLKGRTAR